MGEGVLVFDTMFTPGAGRDLRRVAEAVTGKPVRWVVNSHRDYDHYLGNQAFADVVRIGTRATRRVMEQRTPALIELVRTQHASFLEEFRGRIAAETDPILREELTHEYGEHAALAAARDGLVPVYPSALRYGVPEKWAAFLVELLALDFRWVVPGHGPLGSRRDVELMDRYVREIPEWAAGSKPVPEPFRSWKAADVLAANLEYLRRLQG